MHSATVTTEGDQIRWAELPGKDPVRVYVHGLGATSPLYFAQSAVHPLLAGHRSLLIDLLGHGHSDRPTSFSYTLEDHADTLAAALRAAGSPPPTWSRTAWAGPSPSSWPPATRSWCRGWSSSTPTWTR